MGKRNRDAGRDLKPSQSEREVNQPATNSERAQPQHSAGDPFPYIYVGLHRSVPSKWQPQASAQTQTQETSENAQPSGYIMRALIAVREIVRRGFTFLDKHHGSVAAIAASIATVATIAIAALTIYYVRYSGRQWRAMLDANKMTEAALNVSQRAYVTVGRKDGVVADFVIPKDPKKNADIIIYFQNSGRLPARFAWGTMGNFLIHSSGTKYTGITYTHRNRDLLIRTRDKKTGAIGEGSGSTNIIAGDSVFISTLGIISQKDLAELPTNEVGLLIPGMFEYCDELGNHFLKSFVLAYRSNAPTSSLSFLLIGETTLPTSPLPQPTATTEYLPPCETSTKHEENQKKIAKP